MDSFPSLIPIKLELKVSEAELKTELKTEYDVINGEAKAVKDIPDLECRIEVQREIQNDETGEEKEMLAAYLTLLNIKEDVKIGSNFLFCIKTAGFLEYRDTYYTPNDDSHGVDVCSFGDLFHPEKKLIVNGELVVEIKGIIFLKKKENQYNKLEYCLTERLWKDEDERDFTIVVKDDNECKTEIKIHKIVLALRSPVFKRMFKTDMEEKQEGKVEITDFDLDTVKFAIAFCYDQEIFEDYHGLKKLVALHRFADKYDIEDLKRKTELDLVEMICLEDICEITNDAINLNAPELHDFCFRFLLLSVKEGIPIKDIDYLDNQFALHLLRKSLSVENC